MPIQKKICFFHNRKAGGTAIKDYLGDEAEVLADGVLGNIAGKSQGFETYRLPTVVAVRNPWDRFMSAWRYCRSTRWRSVIDVCKYPPTESDIDGLFRQGGSLAFKLGCVVNCLSLASPVKRRSNGHDFRHLTRQQTNLFINSSGEMAVDHIVYLENLENDLASLANRYGLNPRPIEKKNARKKQLDYRDVLDSRAVQYIGGLWPKDVTYLGYHYGDGPGKCPSYKDRLRGLRDD